MNLVETIKLSKEFRKNQGKRPKYYEYVLRQRVRPIANHLWLEFGVFEGHTLSIMHRETPGTIYGFDSFEGLPEDWIKKHPRGAYKTGLPPKEQRLYLEQKYPRARIIVGMFQDTLPEFLLERKENITVLHLDADLYSSTAFVLEQVESRIVPGTMILFDELFGYNGWENHEYKALVEFIERTGVKLDWIAHVSNAGQAACLVS